LDWTGHDEALTMNEPQNENSPPTEAAPAQSAPAGTRLRTAAIGILVVALAAAGSAIAASKVYGGSSSAPSSSTPERHALPDRDRRGNGLAAAAAYLGLSESQLFAQISQGKTLADIAGSTPGKSVEGLVTAMVSAAKANLDALVASGRLAQSQADSIVSELTMRIEAMVRGDRFRGPHRWGFGGPPPGDRAQPATPPAGTTL
jgi:hypothetical protein